MTQKADITLDTKISRNPDVAWRVLGEFLIAVTPSDNRVHRFNETGTFIWKCLEEAPIKLGDIKRRIEDHFNLQGHNAEKDLFHFVFEVTGKGIVHIEP
ncbi:PqqD family protein [Fibrobacterota bacterium]